MSITAERSMPVIDAYPVILWRGDHWRAQFFDGERTYPSRDSMARAAQRIGVAVRFHDRVSTPARDAGASRERMPVSEPPSGIGQVPARRTAPSERRPVSPRVRAGT